MKRILSLMLVLSLVLAALAGCAAPAQSEATPVPSAAAEATQTPEPTAAPAEEPAERTITDLAGNTVTLPPAKDLDRVVIIAPPLLSTLAAVMKDTSMVVGVHKTAIDFANPQLLPLLVPNAEEINTAFLTGFASNTEELLKLEPDVILVYGDFQKEGLASVSVPVVDFFIQNQQNEAWSVGIDKLMREIFGAADDNSLQAEWDAVKARVAPILSGQTGEKKKGLMIMANTGDKITVRGAGSYGDDWLLSTGLTNVAGELSGDGVEVTMEQIYAWNPELIYVFNGIPAAGYLSGSIKGQDWSQVAAFQKGEIYDTPVGVMNWASPGADSPLMLLWMVSKNFPDQLGEADVRAAIKEYYARRYNLALTDELVTSILNPHAAQ